MTIRLSKQATKRVAPQDFWKAVALATVLVCGISLYTTEIQHLPIVKAWFWISLWLRGGILVWVWGRAALQCRRFGRQVFSWPWVALLIGYTLFMGEPLLPHAPAIVGWVSNAGMLMIMAGILSPLVEFGRRREAASTSISDDLAE